MSKRFQFLFILALLASSLGGAVTSTPAQAAGVLYAAPFATGSGDCSSWANACTLHTAIANSANGDQIWVQQGTYKPDTSIPAEPRQASFSLKNGVEIYGGFNGTETQFSQRNPAANITILSGEIGTPNDPSDNSYHVVKAEDTVRSAILDGFTIRGGNATSNTYPDHSGGGLFNNGGNLTLKNLIFSGNSASYGGGMYNRGSLTLTNVTFSENFANGWGGGMHNSFGNANLTNVIFSRNQAGDLGGGLQNFISSVILTNVTFSGNSGERGGGMHHDAGSLSLVNATFSGNSANYGGGIFNKNTNVNTNPTLTNVTISGNSAGSGVDSRGGGMFNDNSNPTLLNVTFSENSAINAGGGIFNSNNSSPRLINTIIANSSKGGDCVNDTGTLDAASSNNLIEKASSACGLTNGANGNITGVPAKLGPLGNNGGPTKTHALLPGSPAIEAGKDASCPETDQRGIPRPRGLHCDIGAFESRNFTIKGNAGAAGVTLHYTDGIPKKATSQPNGTYSFTVPEGWSGTVTPSHHCFAFQPPSRTYTNVKAHKTGQNYSAAFNPASTTCAQVRIIVNGTAQGSRVIPKNKGQSFNFTTVNDGPVLVNGRNSVKFIASERVTSYIGGQPSHVSEMMGFPRNLADTKYAFPVYDSLNFNSRLQIANVSNANATVTLRIINQEMTGCTSDPPKSYPYTLAPGESVSVGCVAFNPARWNAGPVVVESSGGKIIASLRVRPKGSNPASFSEVMGVPASLWASMYAFPWYNNRDRDTQLRFANVGNGPTQVRLFIGDVQMSNCTTDPPNSPYPYLLGKGASLRVSCAGVNDGPVRVVGTAGVPIVASLRVLPKGSLASFSEFMGIPSTQFAARYAFPWYNNKDLKTQMQVGNIGNASTQVRVFIGRVEKTTGCTSVPPMPYPYTIETRTSLRISCTGVNNGPLKVVGTPADVPIVVSLRLLPNNSTASFSELMGLPFGQLATSYLFPWYNGKTLETQLWVAVP